MYIVSRLVTLYPRKVLSWSTWQYNMRDEVEQKAVSDNSKKAPSSPPSSPCPPRRGRCCECNSYNGHNARGLAAAGQLGAAYGNPRLLRALQTGDMIRRQHLPHVHLNMPVIHTRF
jgi:hypothetical protein